MVHVNITVHPLISVTLYPIAVVLVLALAPALMTHHLHRLALNVGVTRAFVALPLHRLVINAIAILHIATR